MRTLNTPANVLVIFCVLVVGLYLITNLMTGMFSASSALRQFAQLAPGSELSYLGSLEPVRQALQQQLPGGTPEETVLTYLRTHGVRETPSPDAEWKSYHVDERERQIIVSIKDAPFWRFNLSCQDFAYLVMLTFDDQRRLNDIQVMHTGNCL